ncbi:MAG: trimethylamine methyltransferase family protein, partial [Bacillota bacterium]|nr:trimethylamine methyltransferase family protein [Bacillota bacterium]
MIDFKILDDAKLQEIADASYHILETIGVEVNNEEAIGLLKEAGCAMEGTRVTIPRTVVAKALETVPAYIKVYDRNGNEAMNLGGKNSYYGAGPTCPNFMDSRTGERRISRKSDAAEAALVSDALPNIDYVMSLV